jgi:hypothetical protein
MKKIFIVLSLFFTTTSSLANENYTFMFETGAVWQNRNDSKISPANGTRIAIDDLDDGPFFHHRAEARYKFNSKHAIRAVYAPLDINITGSRDTPTSFNGVTFDASSPLEIRFRFNSYRLTYIYSFWDSSEDILNLGITAKIRDAVTSVSQNGNFSEYDNIGFVPLIYFEYQKKLTESLRFNINFDGAIASQGRAVDLALKLRKRLNNNTDLGIGVRTLEGGAENDKVFTFSWFTYAVADLTLRF